MSKTHDKAYKNSLVGLDIEAVDVMESMLLTNIPEEHHETLVRNFRNAMAFKYQCRQGLKDDPKKELQKAKNWINRAETGSWIAEDKHKEFRDNLELPDKQNWINGYTHDNGLSFNNVDDQWRALQAYELHIESLKANSTIDKTGL